MSEDKTLEFDLLKIRHLAAENESSSLFSGKGSGSSAFLDETNLEPLKHPLSLWSELLVAKTEGVWIATTDSGFGILYYEQKIRIV